MDRPRDIILSEVSQKEKDKILYAITYMWNLKYDPRDFSVVQWSRL